MAIIKNHTDGTWIVSYSRRPGKNKAPVSRRRIGITSEREAKRIYAELILEVDKKIESMNVPGWGEIVESFLEDRKQRGYSQKTLHSDETCIKAHSFPHWKDRPITSITRSEVLQRHKDAVGDRKIGHQGYILSCFRRVFQHAVDAGYIPNNPVPQIKQRAGDKIKLVLNEEQTRRFLTLAKQMNDEWYPHWATAVYTGMRNGELYALTWDNVDLDGRKIFVKCSWNNKDGFKDTKSGDDRVVEIPPNLVPILRELKLCSAGQVYVLPRLGKWDRGEQARELKRFLLGMGLPPIRFHDLRATWATLLLGKGVAPIKVMKMGGWKNIETMMIYTRKAGVDIRGSTDCLDLHNPSKNEAEVYALSDRSRA